MPLTPFPVEEFGGLNVLADPTEVGMGAAVDLSNVDFDRPGRLRTRLGLTTFATLTATTSVNLGILGFETTAGFKQVLVSYANSGTAKYEAFNANTSASITTASPASSAFSAARFGDQTHERAYIANGSDTIWRWDGAAFSQPAGMPIATYTVISPSSNRLVVANGSGATMGMNKSRVAFSEPGLPETWTYAVGPPETGNFVDLTPGDGSAIRGLAAWQNLLFAFKRDRFFVFTGESTKSDGTSQFNYRPVEGFGTLIPPVSGNEGVYFYDGNTVWLTTGATPTRVGRPIEQFLAGNVTLGGLTGNNTAASSAILGYSLNRLYLSVLAVGGSTVTFVFDPNVDAWTVYSQSIGAIAGVSALTHPLYSQRVPIFINNGGTPKISYLDPGATADGGTAITWAYQTGYSSAGGYYRQRIVSSGERKNHFKVDILGSGTVTHQVLTLNGRPNDVADTGGSVTLGTAPALARGERRRGARGTHFAHKLSGSGPAVVNGMTYWLQGIEQDT